MTTRKIFSRAIAAVAVAGVAAGVTALAAGTASADPASSVQPCTSNQFTTKLVYGGAGAGNRYGAIQLTANPGERCSLTPQLPVTLTGAHNVLVDYQIPADAPSVAIVDGSSAYVPLHWTGIEPSDNQQTPNGISVAAPSDSNQRGDYIDPSVFMDWTLGAVDADSVSHTIDVGPVTQGLAPTA
ncbi:DUF4232 domain-containing protein [Amycolatopsis sp. FDAARGOS 1241]|uniref:DUF4232 domain-containing protein n=1 Tax=Amycolatopsis sp. FDAARGOS 1241 TaxID=2778070 RepID=UPI001950B9AC|nr:DUF4232 domain-containing protein [Amycolatopsis sp. FDAARGOS 1241]QRP45232.1 DUF4232 domain-containing protein [Amycolatopsis sp. FDAARGOS 1241]